MTTRPTPSRYRTTTPPLACVFAILLIASQSLSAEIEGVQPAALDQPRVNVVLRRDAKGPVLGAGKNADAESANIQAFLDTGASGIVISGKTAGALGVTKASSGGKPVAFHDVGVGGGETFGVSEPLVFSIGPSNGIGDAGRADYPITVGPFRAQVSSGGGLIEMLTGGLDVVGMPAIKGHVVVLDPRPVDTFGDSMRTQLLDPRADRKQIPKTDLHVSVSYASFARFTRLEPAAAQGPNIVENPFVGPSPTDKKQKDVAPIVVSVGEKKSSGAWLLDTGAAASMISSAQAKKLGVTYVDGTKDTGSPKLAGVPADQQFTLDIGGIGGQKKSAGFYLDTLTLPTREREPIVYKRAPVLVADITVEDPQTKEQVTLDGVLGMNFFVASADVKMSGLLPDIGKLTPGAYQLIVFDEPNATLGLQLKPEFRAARHK